jgi:hypothetical protein
MQKKKMVVDYVENSKVGNLIDQHRSDVAVMEMTEEEIVSTTMATRLVWEGPD